MAERGKAKYAYLSSGSNNVVKTGAGTVYGFYGSGATGTIWAVDAHRFPVGTIDINNSTSSNTIGKFAAGPLNEGIAFDTGLVVAFSSNIGGLTVEFE